MLSRPADFISTLMRSIARVRAWGDPASLHGGLVRHGVHTGAGLNRQGFPVNPMGAFAMLHRISYLGFRICLFFLLASPGFATDWLSIHGSYDNNAWRSGLSSQVTSLASGPSWDTGAGELAPGAGMALRGTTVYAVAMRDGGNWDPSDDKVWIKALNAADGTLIWQSPFLDAGNSVSYASIAGPTIDPADGAIYYAAGRTMNRLSPTSGTVAWSTTLTSATTSTTASLELINCSPAIGAGKVFIETYDDYMGGYRDKQIVAFNAADGLIAWSHKDGGTGRIRPIYLSNIASGVVLTEVFDGSTSHGIAAYAATDGSLVWSHLTAPAPWSLSNPIEAPFIYSSGKIYGVSYSGSGTGQLFCVDASNGSLVWKVSSIESDTAPLLVNGTIYLYGGPFGNAQLAAYSALDGSLIRSTTIGGYCFRNGMAATDNHIYLTQSDFFGSDPTTDLVIVNVSDGTIADRVTATYGGPVMIDSLGGIFAHYTTGGVGGLRAFGKTVPVELSFFEVH
ncbi:PQQ-like beta-propeller repeat protein [bacterium]|nr:PQQ-like beta-propeller repeat protein [bacterium]